MAVEFEEPKYSFERKDYSSSQKNTPVMNMFIKMKLAKTPVEANIVMIATCIFCVALSIIILMLVL